LKIFPLNDRPDYFFLNYDLLKIKEEIYFQNNSSPLKNFVMKNYLKMLLHVFLLMLCIFLHISLGNFFCLFGIESFLYDFEDFGI